MKKTISLIITLTLVSFVFAAPNNEVFELSSKVGFIDGKDKIETMKVIGDDRILLIGNKTIQVWNYETGKLISTKNHEIPKFASSSWLSRVLLFNIPAYLSSSPRVVDPDGRWLATIEKVGSDDLRSVVIRDLKTLDQTAVLKLDGMSVDWIFHDRDNKELRVFGESDDVGKFASWTISNFEKKYDVTVDEFAFYMFNEQRTKVFVGAGAEGFDWFGLRMKGEGNSLTLRNLETNKIEKTYLADGFDIKSSYNRTTLSKDGKQLLSVRENSIVVWDVDGDGKPKYVVKTKNEPEIARIVDRRYFVIAENENLQVYEFAGNGKPLYTLSSATPGDTVVAHGASLDGEYLVVGDDRSVSILNTNGDGTPIKTIESSEETEKIKKVSVVYFKGLVAVSKDNRDKGKSSWTDFYKLETGEFHSKAETHFGNFPMTLGDPKYLIGIEVGGAVIWNFEAEQSLYIPLKFYQPPVLTEDDQNNQIFNSEMPYNTEHVTSSPDSKYLLKWGDDIVSIYDLEKREEIQRLFDPKRVKYSKKSKKVKKSGLKDASWTPDGKYVYASDSKSRSVSFWKVGS